MISSIYSKSKLMAGGLLLSFCLSGCATIFSGKTQSVRLKSYPSGARVYHNGKDTGMLTPTKMVVSRSVPRSGDNSKNEHVFTFKKDGYDDVAFYSKRKVNGKALLGDFIFLPVLSHIIDFSSSSIYRFDHKVDVRLKKSTTPPKPIEAVVVDQPKPAEQPVSGIPVNTANIEEPSVEASIPKAKSLNENAVAVVIGNKNYINGDIPMVEYAWNDAETVKKYLMEGFGFHEGNIIYIPDASLTDFNRTFGNKDNAQARLFNLVKPDESDVFIYYSGHGAPDLEKNEAYLVPVDCQDISLLQFEGYSLNTLYANLNKIPFRSLTVVVDACFSGNSENGMLIKQASPVVIRAANSLIYNQKVSVFSSSENTQISSWYPQQKHSLFTYYFLRGLQGEANKDENSKELTLAELRDYLNEKVPYMARRLHNRSQIPTISGEEQKVIFQY